MYNPSEEKDKRFFDAKLELSASEKEFSTLSSRPLHDNLKERFAPSRSPEDIQARREKARDILTRNPSIIHDRNNLGETPLITSILHGEKVYWDVITQLIAAGADLNRRVQEGRTPLKMLEVGKSEYQGEKWIEEFLINAGAHL